MGLMLVSVSGFLKKFKISTADEVQNGPVHHRAQFSCNVKFSIFSKVQWVSTRISLQNSANDKHT